MPVVLADCWHPKVTAREVLEPRISVERDIASRSRVVEVESRLGIPRQLRLDQWPNDRDIRARTDFGSASSPTATRCVTATLIGVDEMMWEADFPHNPWSSVRRPRRTTFASRAATRAPERALPSTLRPRLLLRSAPGSAAPTRTPTDPTNRSRDWERSYIGTASTRASE